MSNNSNMKDMLNGDAIPFVIPQEPLNPIKKILRTPEERFEELNLPYQPNYIHSHTHGTVRIHYLDEGPKDAKETWLLMHGEPSWSFLYRHMIPILTAKGFRCICPDLVGFGRSDKPVDRNDYSYERQVNWMTDLVVGLKLNNVNIFCQDWGGLVGLRVTARLPERFLRIVVSNTGMPIGGGLATKPFKFWASVVSQQMPDWGEMMAGAVSGRKLTDYEKKVYNAPYPDESYKPATRIYPQLVPQTDEHMSVEENKGAWRRVFSRFTKPLITIFGKHDNVSTGGEKIWIANCPGAKGQKHKIIDAGHFVQEDAPELMCELLIEFVNDNPVEYNPPFAEFNSRL